MSKPNIIGDVLVLADVEIGENVSLFHGASIRGDEAKITIGDNSNIQDNATIHCDKGLETKIGNYVTVGHNAIVHSATIGDNTIIGMGAIVLNGAKIGKNCIVGAGALVGQRKEVPDNTIVIGNPFKILRQVSEKDIEGIKKNAEDYVKLGEKYGKCE